MTQSIKVKESRKRITISSNEGEITVDNIDYDEKQEKAHIHIKIKKDKKKEWMDFVDDNENINHMTQLIKEGVHEYIEKYKPGVDRHFASVLLDFRKDINKKSEKTFEKHKKKVEQDVSEMIKHEDFKDDVTLDGVLTEIQTISEEIARLNSKLLYYTNIANKIQFE